MGLRTPFGNGPGNDPNPVPNAGALPPATPPTPMPQGAASVPQDNPARSPSVLPQGQPQDRAPASPPSDDDIEKAMQAADAQKDTPSVPETLLKVFGDNGVRKNKGQLEYKLGDKWRPLPTETWNSIQKVGNVIGAVSRYGGQIGGDIAGGMAGGPAGAVMGGAAGFTLGDGMVALAKHVLDIPDDDKRDAAVRTLGDVASGAFGSLVGQGASKVAGSFIGGQAAQWSPELRGMVSAGETAAGETAATNAIRSKDSGIISTADQIKGQPGNIDIKNQNDLRAVQAVRNFQKLQTQNQVDALSSKLGATQVPEEEAVGKSGLGWINQQIAAHEQAIKEPLGKAMDAAGNIQLDGSSILSAMRSELERHGSAIDPASGKIVSVPSGDPNLARLGAKYSEFQSRMQNTQKLLAGDPDVNPANTMNLPYLNKFVDDAQDFSNFDGIDRGPSDRSWGKVQYAAKELRDDYSTHFLNKSGDPGAAQDLMAARQNFHENIGTMRDIQQKLAGDPTNYMGQLMDDTPAKVIPRLEFIAKTAGDEGVKLARGGFLDNLVKQNADPVTGKVGADKMSQVLDNTDPKVLYALFGRGGTVSLRTLVNQARVIENTPFPIKTTQDSNVITKMIGALKAKGNPFLGGKQFVSSLFEKQPNVSSILSQQAFGSLDSPSATMAKAEANERLMNTVGRFAKQPPKGMGTWAGNQIVHQLSPVPNQGTPQTEANPH